MKKSSIRDPYIRASALVVSMTAMILAASHCVHAQTLISNYGSGADSLCMSAEGAFPPGSALAADSDESSGDILCSGLAEHDDSNEEPDSSMAGSHRRRGSKADYAIWLSLLFGMSGMVQGHTFTTRHISNETFMPGGEVVIDTAVVHGVIHRSNGPDVNLQKTDPLSGIGETDPDSGNSNWGTITNGGSTPQTTGVPSVPEPGAAALLAAVGTAGSILVLRLRKRR